ncbi:hypothetical protein SAMN05444392_11022 [Seinonella peptonophila]|uniref:Uncharacterized protein n=1 Tax=Seinonella peptonophila TaxID=112248 RepID=A0A1M4ZNF1_9BACL|nr:hypothetical protein SAMN05444392_11022 [Seinonella peptonophila]
MFTIAIIILGLLLALTLYLTIFLGKSQKSKHNATYEQNRIKTLFLLSFIYIVTIICGIGFVYFIFIYS